MGSGHSSDHHRASTSSSISSRSTSSSSSFHQPQPQPPALVVGADGSLREFPAPQYSCVSVSDVLGDDNAGRFFLCSSDALRFDADAPPLGADELLRPGQTYFVLPAAALARPLSPADMAALAVRATDAMAAARPQLRGLSRRRRCGLGMNKACVVPASGSGDDGEVNEKLNQRTLGDGFQTAAAPSRRPATARKLARPMMKRELSIIQEVAE